MSGCRELYRLAYEKKAQECAELCDKNYRCIEMLRQKVEFEFGEMEKCEARGDHESAKTHKANYESAESMIKELCAEITEYRDDRDYYRLRAKCG